MTLRTRFADTRPGTFDAESRTVEAVVATQTPVRRQDMRGEYDEVLRVTPEAVDLSQFVGAPVLDSHNRFELGAVIGRVEDATIQDGELRARLRFSSRDDVAGVVQDVQDGILSRVSVGYTVQTLEDAGQEGRDGRARTRVATRWTPKEASIVAIPADPNARLRSDVMIRQRGESLAATLNGLIDDQATEDRPRTAIIEAMAEAAGIEPGTVNQILNASINCPPLDRIEGFARVLDASVDDLIAAGNRDGCEYETRSANMRQTTQAPQASQTPRTRASIAEIRSIARAAGLGDDFIDRAVDGEMTAEQARANAMQELEARASNGPIQTASRVSLVQDHEDPTAIRGAMAAALAAQYTGRQPEGRATEFMRWDPLAMGAELAQRRGGRIDARDRHATVDALLGRTVAPHATSDFPLLLEDAANKIFLEQYQAAAPTFRQWASRRSFNDFRPQRFLRAGDFPSLQQVSENGELNYGTLSENRETVTAGEYARGLAVSRQMLINGEFVSATGDFATMAATRTAADENAMVYSVISGDGPTLSDGAPLFDASHGNKAGTPAALSVDTLGEAVAALRAQKSLDGIPLNLQPAFLIVGPETELAARKVLGTINPTASDNVNPWAGTMTLVVDANISGPRWHVATTPAAAPSVVFGYVAGNVGPQLQTEIDFDTRALKVRLSVDFGTGAIDFRGLYLNEGA